MSLPKTLTYNPDIHKTIEDMEELEQDLLHEVKHVVNKYGKYEAREIYFDDKKQGDYAEALHKELENLIRTKNKKKLEQAAGEHINMQNLVSGV